MDRIVEPELMDDAEQALAYANADFSESHGRRVGLFREAFPGREIRGPILDLGCGPGDVTFRFARAFPQAEIVAVDGSRPMLDIAEQAAAADPGLRGRIRFLHGRIPGAAAIPDLPYELVMSHSLLHHLHRPEGLWQTIAQYAATPGALVFVADLRRPASTEAARHIVEERSGSEPEVLKRDFYNSLCAAFEPEEVAEQVRAAGLGELCVEPAGEIHLIVRGVRARSG